VNAPELVDHYVFREAIAFLLVQQTAAGAIGTYFYEKENLTVNREATIGYHCKVMFLLGGCYDELEEK
jgi:hypothetical protein